MTMQLGKPADELRGHQYAQYPHHRRDPADIEAGNQSKAGNDEAVDEREKDRLSEVLPRRAAAHGVTEGPLRRNRYRHEEQSDKRGAGAGAREKEFGKLGRRHVRFPFEIGERASSTLTRRSHR